MKFRTFCEYLQKLENTTKRLEITAILVDLIKNLEAEETDNAIYLASGYLKALFETPKFNIAEKMMIKTLEYAGGTNVSESYKNLGDLGNVAYEIFKEQKEADFDINFAHAKLMEIALIEGTGSVEIKAKKLSNLLKSMDGQSAKYTTRIVLNNLRLGFTEITIIDALAGFIGDKSAGDLIEQKYNLHPDIGQIAKIIKMEGLLGLNKINVETGVPILCQKAQRVKDAGEAIEKMGTVWAEFKFDGTRVQLHFDKNKKQENLTTTLFGSSDDYLVKTYTRNLEETTHMYPDIVEAARLQLDAKSAIIDGEAVGFDKKTGKFLPFQEIMQRKRKYDIAEMAKNIPLKYFAFDLLYYNGESQMEKPLRERKALLQKIVQPGETIIVDDYFETDNAEGLHEYFEVAKNRKLEGLIAKKPDDAYQAGARSFSWIKLKIADAKLLDDSVDCVVLGYYVGKGSRQKLGMGGFLVGVYDEKTDSFKTISKIGTGLTEETFVELKKMCDAVKVDKQPANVEMHKMFIPDVFVRPSIIVEIGADEISKSPSHTAGFALRFPRLIKFRTDKSALQTTSLQEIKDMHASQKRGIY